MGRGEDAINQLQELLGQQEELDPELEAYMETSEHGWQMIRHPLVYSVVHHPAWNAMVNQSLKYKTEALDDAMEKRDLRRFVYLHERPYRIDAFMKLVHWAELNDHEYWNLLGDIWTDSENIRQNFEVWRRCLGSDRSCRHEMMDDEERAHLEHDLDDQFTIYRGYEQRGTAMGLSWTTNRIVAKFFARRLSEPGATLYVAQGTVDKADVLGYFDSRSEYEVVVLPENVRGIQVAEIRREKDDAKEP